MNDKWKKDRQETALKYGGKSIVDYSDKELRNEAEANHIWLNAFKCINPSPEFKQEIGEMILAKLDHTDMRDHLGISKMIILTINKS
jgi:hypothetical protein